MVAAQGLGIVDVGRDHEEHDRVGVAPLASTSASPQSSRVPALPSS